MLSHHGVLAAAGVLLAGSPTIAIPRVDNEVVVPFKAINKSVESSSFRLLFLAGLEGTGHHYVLGAGRAMFKANPDLPRIGSDMFIKPFFLPSYMGERASNFVNAEADALEAMQGLAKEAESLPLPGTVYFPRKAWSYPRGNGAGKVERYVDLKKMAEVAESTGIDLRVIYLKRAAEDLIVADTVHRNFQKELGDWTEDSSERAFMEYTRILFTNTAVLHSFLGEIDPSFIVCHDWDRLGDKEQASKIAGFVAPNDELADMMMNSLVDAIG
eukprot:g14125.t1